MDRAKAIDKITKLLKFGKDTRGNPHECAAMLERAQKMMRKYGVSEAELGMTGFGSERVECSQQVNKKSIPARLLLLVNVIEETFGVRPIFGKTVRVSDLSYVVDYIGPMDRVLLAAYSHTVLQRALDAGWREYLDEHPYMRGKRGARLGFDMGFLSAIAEEVQALVPTDEEKAATQAVVEQKYGELTKVGARNNSYSRDTALDGIAAGSQFRLSRPVGQETLKISRN